MNAAWGTAFTRSSDIAPPANATAFFESGAYRNSAYGRDFVDWYNGSLVDHCKRMLETVVGALGRSFPKADIGYKVPGIYLGLTVLRMSPSRPGSGRRGTRCSSRNTGPEARLAPRCQPGV